MASLRGLSLSDPGHADARLPASHKLVEELSVSLMTVVNVYGQLSSEGYITAQAGNGTFVANHLPHLSSAAIRILENHQPPAVAAPFQSRFLDQTFFFTGFGRAIVNALGGPQPQAFWHFLIHLAGIR